MGIDYNTPSAWTPDGLITIGGSIAGFAGFVLLVLWLLSVWSGATRDWVQTPCTVIDSGVGFDPTEPGSTVGYYYVNVEYRYRFEGRDHEGHRYRMSKDYVGKEKANRIVARLPAGQQTVCHVHRIEQHRHRHRAVVARGLATVLHGGA